MFDLQMLATLYVCEYISQRNRRIVFLFFFFFLFYFLTHLLPIDSKILHLV